ncbi:MAG: hypothetical protein IKC01_00295 [Clostridia bacterium]|nr:hypothetical protein [Clostridia bacterium]
MLKRKMKKSTSIIMVVVLILTMLTATGIALEVKDSLFNMNPPTYLNTSYSNSGMNGFSVTAKGSLETEDDYEAYIFSVEDNGALSVNFNHEDVKESLMEGWKISLYYIQNPDEDLYDYKQLTYFDAFWSDVTASWGETGVRPGTYCVIVEPGQFFLPGDFEVNVSFSPTESYEKEFNDTIETADNLRLNRTIYGSSGQRDDDADIDYFKFNITEDTYVNMIFEHTDDKLPQVGWIVRLLTADGQEISSFASKYQDPLLETGKINLRPGTYYVCIETQVQTGITYRLSVETGISETTEFELNDTPQTAEVFPENTIVSGSLAPRVLGLDKDYFKITLTKESYITISFTHELEEDNKDYNGWNIRLIRPESDGTYTEIVKRVSKWNDEGVNITGMGLPAGEYYILVDADSMQYTSLGYELSYICQNDILYERESNDTMETANKVDVRNVYYGTLISTDMNFDRDYYKFEVANDTNIAFQFYHDYTSDSSLAWVATIIDENGKEIKQIESAKNDFVVSTGVIGLKKGTYYILIENDLYTSEDTYWFKIIN